MALYGSADSMERNAPPPSSQNSYANSTPGYSPYGAALQYYRGANQVPLSQIGLQQSQQRNQLGGLTAAQQMAQAQYGQNVGFANQQYTNDMGSLGIQRSNAGIDTDYYNKLLGYVNQNYQGELSYGNTVEDLAKQLLGIQQGVIGTQAASATRGQNAEANAQGAYETSGNAAKLGDINAARLSGLAGAQNTYESAYASAEEAKRQALEGRYGLNTRVADIQHQLDLNDNQLASLDQQAASIGLTRDKMLSSLQQGLDTMNLSSTIGVRDLMDAITSGVYQRQQVAEQIIRQATQGTASGAFGAPVANTRSNSSSPDYIPDTKR